MSNQPAAIFPGGFEGRVPSGTTAIGVTSLRLEEANAEIANIKFGTCPMAAPETGCIGNHRMPKSVQGTTLAGMPTKTYKVEASLNSGANDTRVWIEFHTFIPLASGDRVDLIGAVLIGSGQEVALETAYTKLLASIKKP